MSWTANALSYLQEHGVEIATRAISAVLVIAAAFVVARMLARLAAKSVATGSRRGAMLGTVVSKTVNAAVITVGVMMACDQVGLEIGAIIAGAGVVGLAVGFGAQQIVKDVISGFFLILDDALAEGDVANVGGEVTGVIESVGLRVTKVRAFDGQLWYVQNGEIRKVGNFNRDWVRAVVTTRLAYEQDVAKGIALLQQVGENWVSNNPDLVLEAPEVHGLLGFETSGVSVRLVIKVKAQTHWAVERELRVLVKAAFDQAGIEIPFERQVVYHRQQPRDTLRVVQNGATTPRATPSAS